MKLLIHASIKVHSYWCWSSLSSGSSSYITITIFCFATSFVRFYRNMILSKRFIVYKIFVLESGNPSSKYSAESRNYWDYTYAAASLINSSHPNAAYMRQGTGAAPVQVIACRHGLSVPSHDLKSEIFSFTKILLNISSAKWQPFCAGGGVGDGLTHLSLVLHKCVGELGHHWSMQWLVACSASSHYMNQCWIIALGSLGTIFNEIRIKIFLFCIH